MILDHVGFNVSDFQRSKAFYVAALAPLGIEVVAQGEGWAMLGSDGVGGFWFGSFGAVAKPVHVAFRAKDRADVQAFHTAALAHGGKDNGGPGLRPNYGTDYYAAFVIDLDGNNIEAVCRVAQETA